MNYNKKDPVGINAMLFYEFFAKIEFPSATQMNNSFQLCFYLIII